MQYLFFPLLIICLLSLTGSTAGAQVPAENQAPVVRILKPAADEALKGSTLVPYAIKVDDPEDGNSDYAEIAGREVILLVKYLEDPSLVKRYLAGIDLELASLSAMSKSTCLNCHAADTRLIGPSFDLIAERYRAKDNAKAYLSEKVISGGTGVWGEEKMPPHPDLNREKVDLIVDWILQQEDDPTLFYIGLEGAIRTRVPQTGSKPGVYVLTAFYQDHGSNTPRKDQKLGLQTITCKVRQ